MYCKKCGGKLESYASNCAFCGTPVEKYDTAVNYVKEERNEKGEGLSAIKWIGLTLLPGVPLVGIIIYLVLMFKWASKNNRDVTLRGYARANLIMLVVGILMVVALVAFVMLNPEIMQKLMQMEK